MGPRQQSGGTAGQRSEPDSERPASVPSLGGAGLRGAVLGVRTAVPPLCDRPRDHGHFPPTDPNGRGQQLPGPGPVGPRSALCSPLFFHFSKCQLAADPSPSRQHARVLSTVQNGEFFLNIFFGM